MIKYKLHNMLTKKELEFDDILHAEIEYKKRTIKEGNDYCDFSNEWIIYAHITQD